MEKELAELGAQATARSGAPTAVASGPALPALRRARPRTPRDSAGGSPPSGSGARLGPLGPCARESTAPRNAFYLLILSTNARRSALGSVAMARQWPVGL